MRPETRSRVVDGVLWMLAVASIGVLVIFSMLTEPPVGSARPGDLFLHAGAYATTTFLLLLAAVWRPGRGPGPLPGAGTALPVALVTLGAGLEVAQALGIPHGRDGDLLDAVANGVGIVAGWSAWALFRLSPEGSGR